MPHLAPVACITIRNKVIANLWTWLHENFHKLSEPNKLKVVISLCGKNLPQEVKGEGFGNKTIVIFRNGEKPKEEESIETNRASLSGVT